MPFSLTHDLSPELGDDGGTDIAHERLSSLSAGAVDLIGVCDVVAEMGISENSENQELRPR